MFNIGDKAVYPMHGVGIIESIESRDICGIEQNFYVLKILDNGMTIMVPEGNIDDVGLREVISKRKVRQIYKILEERDVVLDNQTWNRRYREYTEKIKSGSPVEIAKVLRDLCVLRCDKDLSFGERKMFDMAQSLLVKEISVAKNIDEDKVEEDFRKILSL